MGVLLYEIRRTIDCKRGVQVSTKILLQLINIDDSFIDSRMIGETYD